jgi:hypothetical protein
VSNKKARGNKLISNREINLKSLEINEIIQNHEICLFFLVKKTTHLFEKEPTISLEKNAIFVFSSGH